jgi:Xaa-Pro aminopeptidase
VSLSFGSISAVGPNAAVIHYSTDEGDDSKLTREKIYLLDAGAQYLDCSTDITRTHHYGTPPKEEIVIELNRSFFSTTKLKFNSYKQIIDLVYKSLARIN